jgi:hypothetical protein
MPGIDDVTAQSRGLGTVLSGEDSIMRRCHGAQDGWQQKAAASQPFGRLIQPSEVQPEKRPITGPCLAPPLT